MKEKKINDHPLESSKIFLLASVAEVETNNVAISSAIFFEKNLAIFCNLIFGWRRQWIFFITFQFKTLNCDFFFGNKNKMVRFQTYGSNARGNSYELPMNSFFSSFLNHFWFYITLVMWCRMRLALTNFHGARFMVTVLVWLFCVWRHRNLSTYLRLSCVALIRKP